MSQVVFEDYAGISLSAPALGRLKWMRALPGVAIAALSVALLYIDHVRHGAQPPQPPVAADAPQPASPFGVLTADSSFLRLNSVSPAEVGRFGVLTPSSNSPAPAPPPAPTAPFAAADPFGGLADLRPSVSWAMLALRPALTSDLTREAQPAQPDIAANTPASPPLPPRRPADLAAPQVASTPSAGLTTASIAPPQIHLAAPDVTGFISHLFSGTGTQQATSGATSGNRQVAYAPPDATTNISRTTRDNPILRSFMPSAPPGALARYDKDTAVYDIEARVVYLPNGSRIEAHSGYGDLKDDPRRVSVPARGATPPAVYDLTMRESLFHGVQALRLNPVGSSGDQYGRSGFLAHPYMLGDGGDSNGCVSLKDYDAFLAAYQSGMIKKLVVVAKL